jgi:hypothetical protein
VGFQHAVFEGAPDLLVVVDLAVAHEVEASVRCCKRLLAALDVHDGEPPVAEQVSGNLDQAVVVRSPVGDAPHHASGGLRVHAAVSADYSAHAIARSSGVWLFGSGSC